MSILNDDVLCEILKLVNTRTLMNFCVCSKDNLSFLQRNVENFDFNFSNTKITDEGLKYFDGCRYINLRYCKLITDKGFKYLHNARKIDLHYNDYTTISDEGLKYLKKCKWITFRSMGSESKITDAGFKYLQSIGCNYKFNMGFDLFG